MIRLIWYWLLEHVFNTYVIFHFASHSWHARRLNWTDSHLGLIKMKYPFVCSIELENSKKSYSIWCRLPISNRVMTHNGITFFFSLLFSMREVKNVSSRVCFMCLRLCLLYHEWTLSLKMEYNGIKNTEALNFLLRISNDFWCDLILLSKIIHKMLRTDFINLS